MNANEGRAILSPRSVAIIGASDDADRTAGRPLRFLRTSGFGGRVYPINPRRDTVQGERAFPSLASLPETPEHAFILTGTEAAIEAVAECGERGVKVATILASGFSEVGALGEARLDRLRETTRRTGLRLIGPSSLGIVNLHEGFTLTANAAFAEADLPRGSTFVASHSGSMIGALLSRGKARGFGYAGLVSVGNEVDLTLGDLCSAALDDARVESFMLFLESLNHADALRRFAVAAAKRGKPVVAFKLGRSSEAAELATSHTGALAGDDEIADVFLRECGIARVETLDGLIESLPLLRRLPIASVGAKPRIGLVTTTGGGGAMVVDQLGVRDISVVPPSQALVQDLCAAGAEVAPARIVDLTLAGTNPAIMKAALQTMLGSGEFDLVVAVVGSSARNHPHLAVAPIVEIAERDTPLASFIVPDAPAALAMLAEAGVPAFRTPESCADVIRAAFRREAPTGRAAAPKVRRSVAMDEVETYELLDRLGIEHAPTAVIEGDRVPTDLPFGFPVAAKVLDAAIVHKSDIGGVVLGIADYPSLQAAAASIHEGVRIHRPEAGESRILVQPMERGLGEALLGYRIDPDVGPVILLAAGGVTTELYKDRALRLAPVTVEVARAMIAQVKAFQVLSGFRGAPRGDLAALAQTVAAFSRIAELAPEIQEAEVNPLILRREGEGVVAVDGVARRAAP